MAQQPKNVEATETALDYQEAIAQAEVTQRSDRRPELRRCIKHWGALRIKRVGLLNAPSGEGGSVLLEIGNSGFPRYDYVRVDGFLLKSSFIATVDLSHSALSKHLMELYANPPIDLHGSADAEVDDGDCYYLTVIGGGMQRSVAVYGSPKATPTGLLIREMLDVATKPNKGD
ncbi:hypothetical protein [Thermomonas sp.]|uniref:hypothetical protein n=1 Tax=Thermomonas sp. TaxID=1971895 RepID=UPI0035B0631E